LECKREKEMKSLLLILGLLVLIGSASGLSANFQNPSDFSAQVAPCYLPWCFWFQNTTGGNNFMTTSGLWYIEQQTASPLTYSAATVTEGSKVIIRLWDSTHTPGVAGSGMLTYLIGNATPYDRCELKIIGGTPYLYVNGILENTSPIITVNPSYTGWLVDGAPGSVDDIIWGSSQPLSESAPDKYIFGIPETGYFLMKDLLNPAASGLYLTNQTDPNGTPLLMSSYYFSSTFGKSNNITEAITLSSPTGGIVQTQYSGTSYAGQVFWNLSDFFAIAPYGLYQVDMTNAQLPSTYIAYIGSGAYIQFDKSSYAVGETASAAVQVSDGYYDLTTYSYHVVIQDIYGTKVYDEPITFSASPHIGTATYQWLSGDIEGVYYGLIYRHRVSDGVEQLMGYAITELNSNLVISGYVKDAETAGIISGATVNVTQGVITDSLTSAADGNYTSVSIFSENNPTTIIASEVGYETYQHVFTPLIGGNIPINISLMPDSPTYTNVALGGIARTPPYNRTIDSATIAIQNANASYTVTTNSAGYYIKNSMRSNEWWNIWGSKTGFENSSIYNKLVVGA
jgi:hypothetical protein